MPALWEDRIFGHSAIGKALWLVSFPLTQPLRSMRYGIDVYMTPWWTINAVINASYFFLLAYLWGIPAIVFLGVSTVFAVGLHPLGARWVAEHYSFHPHSKQETFSYYGIVNLLAFNIGRFTCFYIIISLVLCPPSLLLLSLMPCFRFYCTKHALHFQGITTSITTSLECLGTGCRR